MTTGERHPTLLDSCARAATAAEAKFRIDRPNSSERSSRVVALDEAAAGIVERVAGQAWQGARFFTYVGATPVQDADDLTADTLLRTMDGEERLLSDELDGADVVVMVATSAAGGEAASVIGEACLDLGIMTAGLVVGADADNEAVNAMRAFAAVLVVSRDEDYVDDMLVALRA